MPFEARRPECSTDTQHIVNLSAYHWAIETLGDLAGMRVLDAACGTGYGSYALVVRARFVVGVDRDLATVCGARRRYRRPNLSFLPMECEALAFRDASFDAVVSFETIEHLVDDRQFIRQVARLLTRDGWLILSAPHGEGLGTVPRNPFHRREYVWDELQRLLAEHFSSIRLYGRRLGRRLAELERELKRVRRLDPAGLRGFLPRRFRHRVGSLISRLRGRIGLEEVTTVDVEYLEGLATGSATLLAVCRRRGGEGH